MEAIDLIIESRTRELTEGFKVNRVLPSAKRRMVGPFIFLDAMGPEVLTAGRGLDVAPHPHIGLATVTYLFTGELLHRDSLGSEQLIQPGAVNWMTAGRGIAHSERTPPNVRQGEHKLFGIQSWVALPVNDEESEPAFVHHPSDDLPVINETDFTARVIAGRVFGRRSPVEVRSEMVYADVEINAGGQVPIEPEFEERAVYVVNGKVKFLPDNADFNAGNLLVLKPGQQIVVSAVDGPARLMLLGGEPFAETRFIWWNFVSSSQDRIEQAKSDWREGKFGQVVGETEFIPLPMESKPAVVRYP
ncbi:MAG TPA: pirin family protein [Pyrinomonadaceae bacterium]|nr:pirin family protein [Pyrinomonadaceae bacterium]